MSRTQRDLLSQNFLWNRELVNKLIRNSYISQNDSVFEIGAGKGIITEELLGACKEITAIEADERLLVSLKNKLASTRKVSLISGNFLEVPLPKTDSYKVFSNIPFSITGEVVKKLLFSPNPPADSYLVVQKEAAEKLVIRNGRNTMLAVIFHPFFDINVTYNFKRIDFRPPPNVDSCLVRITKRDASLIDKSFFAGYRDFIVYYFTRDRLASSYSFEEWRNRFATFQKENNHRLHNKIQGSFDKWRIEEQNLLKIHRTRKDRRWKRFKG